MGVEAMEASLFRASVCPSTAGNEECVNSTIRVIVFFQLWTPVLVMHHFFHKHEHELLKLVNSSWQSVLGEIYWTTEESRRVSLSILLQSAGLAMT